MDIKKFFKEAFGDKEIEIKVEPDRKEQPKIEEKDERATRRSIFESRILRVIALTTGLNALSHAIPKGPELSPQFEQYKKEHSELNKKLGSQFDAFLFEMETYKTAKERASEDIHLEVGDFEEVDASNKGVKEYFEKGYPKEWLSRLQGVRMVPLDLDMHEEYGLKNENASGEAKQIAYIEKRGRLGGSSIIFTKEMKNFFSAASHELAHANDWLGRNDLSDEYRISMLYNVMARVESPDRFKSTYVESISNKDPQKQLMYKVTEYWAEINQFYFDAPAEAKTRLPAADLELIEKHLKTLGIKFNVETAAREREALEAEMATTGADEEQM